MNAKLVVALTGFFLTGYPLWSHAEEASPAPAIPQVHPRQGKEMTLVGHVKWGVLPEEDAEALALAVEDLRRY